MLAVIVASLTGKDILVSLINNFVALSLVRELPGLVPEAGLPRCGQVNSQANARKWIDLAETLGSEERITRLNQGRVAWSEGKCEESEQIFKNYLANLPGDFRAGYWMYWLTNTSQDPEQLGISPHALARLIRELGRRAERVEMTEAALAWYELSFDLSPDQSLAYQIINLSQGLGKTEKTKNFLTGMQYRYNKKKPEFWWAVGKIAFLNSDWINAAQAFQQAASLADDPYDYLLEQASALYRSGEWVQEEQAYRKAIQVRPSSIYPYIDIGQIRRREHNFESALEWYKKAESLSPDHFFPKFVIGELFFENNQLERARKYLEEAILLNPGYENSYYYLAHVYFDLGDIDRAIKILIDSISILNKPPVEWFVLLGDINLQNGDRREAIKAYQQALNIKPEDSSIREKITKLTNPQVLP